MQLFIFVHIFADRSLDGLNIMKKVKLYTRFITILVTAVCLACHTISLHAYSFMPLVTSYANQEHLCATQAWDATQDSIGTLYFATSDGVLIYDGVNWNTISIEGASTVRSVHAEGNRVYIGAYEQLGYLERNSCGQPEYHSLNSLANEYEFHDDEFWDIIPYKGKLYFQSFRSLFCFDGNKIDTYQKEGIAPLYLFNAGGRLFSQLIGKGLYEFTGNDCREILPRERYGGSNIIAMLEDTGGRYILCTESNGLYRYDLHEGKITKFATTIDSEIKSFIINRAYKMADGHIVLGTIRNGIYAVNDDGTLAWHYNLDNGLGNNSVLGLNEDSTGNMWVMMDHGISVVHSGLSYSILMPHAGEPYLGMTYDILRKGDNLYIGTNQGLYTYSYADNHIINNEVGQSQIWHIDSFDNQIFIGGGILSMQISANGRQRSTSESSTDITKGVIHNKEVLVETSYYSMRIYTKQDDGTWAYSHYVNGFGAPLRQVEIDNDGSIWCSHIAQGVIHIELSPDLRTIEKIEKIKIVSPGHHKSTSFVMKIRGNIAISDGDSLYSYNHDTGTLQAMTKFHTDLPTIKEIYSSTPVDDKLFWLSSRKSYTLVSYEDGHYRRRLTIPLDILSLQSNGVNNKVYVDKNHNCYFAINNGIGCVSLNALKKTPNKPRMTIASIESVTPDGIKQRLKLKNDSEEKTEVPGNAIIQLSYPSYNFTAPRFMYTLEGAEDLTAASDEPQISFAGLKHGEYKFMASIIDDSGKAIDTVSYEFIVPTPPYLSFWAMSGYAIAFAAITIGLSKLYTRKQINRQRRDHEIERVAQNVKILEQERIISEQQNQILQNELSTKSKELASMALVASYKHQVIENLRESIAVQRRKGVIETKEIDTLIKTINSDIGKNEFWDIFQNNFDLIHENFFKNLRKQFPTLTPIDMKFCALLRLNMSTKDIAKFTQLSIRGVETARYRLRRKLGLDSKTSIVQFLIDFK